MKLQISLAIIFLAQITFGQNHSSLMLNKSLFNNCIEVSAYQDKFQKITEHDLKSASNIVTVQDSTIYEQYNKISESWEINKKRYYAYDQDWHTLNFIDYIKNENSDNWQPFERVTYSNNRFDKYSQWNPVSQIWIDSLEYKYFDGGRIINIKNKTDGSWEPLSKITFIYDNWGDYEGDTLWYWNNSSNTWKMHYKTELYYSGGNRNEYTDIWNEGTEKWDNFKKTEIYETDDGDIESIEHLNWNSSTNDYELYERDEYTFTDLGSMGYISQIVTSKINDVRGILELSERSTAYFGKHDPTSIKEINRNSICIYPNPFSDYIQVIKVLPDNHAKIEMVDLNGKLVFHDRVSGNSKINTDYIKSGIYFFRIIENQRISTGKIIKTR